MIDKIHVISLARCQARREGFVRQFSKLGIPYRIIEAVDGKEPEARCEGDPNAFKHIYSRAPTPGELGCYASHLKALEIAVCNEADFTLICEDDLVFTRPWAEIVAITEKQIAAAPSAALIYPGGHVMKNTEAPVGGTDWKGALRKLDKLPVGTQCYIVSREFASYFLHYWSLFYRPIDEAFRILPINGDKRWSFYMANPEDRWCAPDFNFKSELR